MAAASRWAKAGIIAGHGNFSRLLSRRIVAIVQEK
jgi:hypothetical protein